jgi:RimJ/RimL family protein N-acetyltransferase
MEPRPITLTGRYVRLQPLQLEHAADLLAALMIAPEIWQWRTMPAPQNVTAMQELLAAELKAQAQGTGIAFAQVALPLGQAVGVTTYMNISRRDRGLEIGSTWLGKPWQRTGINTEAKYLLLRHAFEDLGAVRVQLKTDSRNRQSQAAIERLGALREGVLRKHMLTQGDFLRDSVMYSIIDVEWTAVKARLEALLAAHDRPASH